MLTYIIPLQRILRSLSSNYKNRLLVWKIFTFSQVSILLKGFFAYTPSLAQSFKYTQANHSLSNGCGRHCPYLYKFWNIFLKCSSICSYLNFLGIPKIILLAKVWNLEFLLKMHSACSLQLKSVHLGKFPCSFINWVIKSSQLSFDSSLENLIFIVWPTTLIADKILFLHTF